MDVKQLLTTYQIKSVQNPALIFEERPIPFRVLANQAFACANYLASRGIGAGDAVALSLPNTPDAVNAFLGIFSLGAVAVPLDFMLTEHEIITFINHCEARVLIANAKKGVSFEAIKKRCPSLQEIIVCAEAIDSCSSWEETVAQASPEPPAGVIDQESLSSIFYTSGSTGIPKGVMLTYAHLDNSSAVINHHLQVSNKDIFLCGGVPFSHLGGLVYILLMVRFGSTLVLMPRFHPFEFLTNIQKQSVTIFCIVPAMYVAILSLKEYDNFDFSCLRYAVVFGAPSSPQLLKRFSKAYPNARLLNGWGMTETSAPNTLSPSSGEYLDSIGFLNHGIEAQLIDEQGVMIDGEGRGELLVRGPCIMKGYFKDEALTKETITENGWLKTGDIAQRDSQGLYYIVGRTKDMIKVAGEIVFSPEVEAAIQRYPKVREVAVIGVPDALRGEVPKAFIVAKEHACISPQELNDFLKERLAHFKIPHQVEFKDALPKNRAGKVDKQILMKGVSL